MDVGLIRVGLILVVAAVSLAAYFRSWVVRLERAIAREGERSHEDFRTLSQQRREDRAKVEEAIVKLTEKLAKMAERTARIERILARGWMPQLEATAAQAVPDEPPDTR